MSDLVCYSCGISLEALSLPWSRQEICPSCSNYLHCCRMCEFFEVSAVDQCLEDDAEEVTEKASANFCEYFKPAGNRHSGQQTAAQAHAKSELDSLFGEGSADSSDSDDPLQDAEDLFR